MDDGVVLQTILLQRGNLLFQLGEAGGASFGKSFIVTLLPAGKNIRKIILRHALAFVVQAEAIVLHIVEPDVFSFRPFGEEEDGGGDAGVGLENP